jgi:hypothetical protein
MIVYNINLTLQILSANYIIQVLIISLGLD